ncbi:MAG: transcription elongation factor GreA [Bacilli bacterium]|jgi:transcription elongation factor GreA|nr:transcription elongation factor GreA [Acholeplasmataceae bacterium]
MKNKYTIITQDGLKKLQDELEGLKHEREENIEALKEARAQGDLSENADYDAARERQAQIANRIKQIEAILKNHVVIKEDENNNLGKTVTIVYLKDIAGNKTENTGRIEKFTIVGSLESDPASGKISNESPLGSVIVNKGAGEEVVVKPEDGAPFHIRILEVKDSNGR